MFTLSVTEVLWARIFMNKGKLIVFEGADGAGKTTQAKLLTDFLKKKNIQAVLTSFPRYDSAWGKMITRYLGGEFGTVNQVNPYLASMLYAGDRLYASGELKKWLRDGKTVICDRYVASNIAHQAAKISGKEEKKKYIDWLENLEFAENGIPMPDLVFLLTISNSVAQKFMARRVRDIHEVDTKYQETVAKEYGHYAKGKKNWIVVSNMRGSKLRSVEEVHSEVVKRLNEIVDYGR